MSLHVGSLCQPVTLKRCPRSPELTDLQQVAALMAKASRRSERCVELNNCAGLSKQPNSMLAKVCSVDGGDGGNSLWTMVLLG